MASARGCHHQRLYCKQHREGRKCPAITSSTATRLHDMGTAARPPKPLPGPWEAFEDVDAFVDEVLRELAAMVKDGTRPLRSGPKPSLAGPALRKAVMAIWCVCFCGMQWRAIGLLCDIPFGTLYERDHGFCW